MELPADAIAIFGSGIYTISILLTLRWSESDERRQTARGKRIRMPLEVAEGLVVVGSGWETGVGGKTSGVRAPTVRPPRTRAGPCTTLTGVMHMHNCARTFYARLSGDNSKLNLARTSNRAWNITTITFDDAAPASRTHNTIQGDQLDATHT